MILMSPKSLLRHKSCISTIKDLTSGEFQDFIPDATPARNTDTLILCSGKVFYDLIEARGIDSHLSIDHPSSRTVLSV